VDAGARPHATETANWLANGFLAEPLRDWDVSRPAPYFGFEIPTRRAITSTSGSTRRSAT
jgi:methionyl-tRNA synthetase